MYTRDKLNQLLDVHHFIYHGKFAIDDINLNTLYKLCNYQFGKDIVILTFVFKGYDIAIIVDDKTQSIKGFQIEHFLIEHIEEACLASIATYDRLSRSDVAALIETVYQDDDERVVFLQTGTMLYYNKSKVGFSLSLILNNDKSSKNLVKKTLNRML